MVDKYGACVVRKAQRQASEAILRNVDNGTLMHEYPRLLDYSCMPAPAGLALQARFEGAQYRYALADALVRQELASVPPPVLDAVPPLDHRRPTEPSRFDKKGRSLSEKQYAKTMKDYMDDEIASAISAYGECVVRANPAAAHALLMSQPESPQENAQFAAMQTTFGICLDEGSTQTFSKTALRGTVAVSYYRLAKAAAGAAEVRK
jgi:hypothetical protein